MNPDSHRDQWLLRIDATGRAQSRYLWILLVLCLFFLALRYASPSAQTISVPLIDLELNGAAVLASGGTIIAFIVLASHGAITAWTTALKEYAGDSWREQTERLDTHPNALDLAIYTTPASPKVVGIVGYFVYPLYLSVALFEAAWLQWWVYRNPAPTRWFFLVVWVLVWSRAAWLIGNLWRQRISLVRVRRAAG